MGLLTKTNTKKALNIAIVDDEETVHDHFQVMLDTYIPWGQAPFSACTYQLEHFYTCEEFEDIVRKHPDHFNFVLLDMNFPEGVTRGATCYQNCSRIFIQNNTSTVLVTAWDQTKEDPLLNVEGGLSTQDLARQRGMLGYVSKALPAAAQTNYIVGYLKTHILQTALSSLAPQTDEVEWAEFKGVRTHMPDSNSEDLYEISYQNRKMNLSNQNAKFLYYIILFLYIVKNHGILSAESKCMQIYSSYAIPLRRSKTGKVVVPYQYLVDFMKWGGRSNVYTYRTNCNRILRNVGYQLSNAPQLGYCLEKLAE